MPTERDSLQNKANFTFKDLSKPRKMAVFFLCFLAVGVLAFWVWQVKYSLNKPFDYGNASDESLQISQSGDINSVLKDNDTDKDGLSDYDELYNYNTSPYLEDSDSDGLTDKEEIDRGSDPACPEGKDCSGTTNASSTVISTPVDTTVSTSSDLQISSDFDEESLQKVLNGQADAAALRQLLIAGGASAEDLELLSDKDLVEVYQGVLESQTSGSTGN